jgi:hypothetical protein
MTYDEYKKHLEARGPLDDISKGLLSAFELGYGQGIKDGKTHFTKALAEPVQEPVAWNSIQIATWIGNQLMHEPSMFERGEVCRYVRSLGRHPTLIKHIAPQTKGETK